MRGALRGFVLGLGLALLVGGPGEAQRPTGGQERARMEAQLRQRFEALVERELALDPETSAELAERARTFAPRRRELARERRLLQREMGEEQTLSEERALEILDDMARLAREEAELLAEEQASLLEILSPPQVVRLYGLRERLGRRIRELGRRGPRGGPGPGVFF
jgi:hypothetical protein